jgi:hypothetical protein
MCFITYGSPILSGMSKHVRRIDSEFSFLDSLRVTNRVCLGRDVRSGSGQNFGSITLMFSTTPFSGAQLENNGVMLPKVHLDPDLTSHHNHTLSITLRWV